MGDMASVGEFRNITAVAAAERFRQFLSERSAASDALAAKAADAGLTLDRSVQSLAPLWKWLGPQLKTRGRFERRSADPSWLIEGHPADTFSGGSIELLDGLVSYLGEVFTAQTGYTWELETQDSRSVTYQQPVFAAGMFVPISVLNAALRRLTDTGEADEQLMYWVGASVANTQAADSAEPDAPSLDVAVSPSDVPGFDWEIWVDEATESFLGTEAFDLLESDFARMPHVINVVHEDREIYLIQAPNTTQKDLETAARNAVGQHLQ